MNDSKHKSKKLADLMANYNDDVISDCLDKLKTWYNGLYVELNEIVPWETQFYNELSSLYTFLYAVFRYIITNIA